MPSTAERKAQRAKNNAAAKPIQGPRGRDTVDLDEDVAALVLRQVAGPRIRRDVAPRVMSGTLLRTMDGASTLTLTLTDPDRLVLDSGVFGRDKQARVKTFRSLDYERQGYDRLAAVDLKLDGAWFRLVQMSVTDTQMTLTFEDRDISYLRQHARTKRVSRNKLTRAQFVHTLVREVHAAGGITFKSPDEDKRQQIALPEEDEDPVEKAAKPKTRVDRDEDKDPGLASASRLTVKGNRATAQQQRVIEDILDVGHRAGASDGLLQTAVMVAIQESTLDPSATNGTHVGVFQQNNQTGSVWRQKGGATRDVRKDAGAFFSVGRAIEIDTRGGLSLPALGARIQGYPPGVTEYAPWEAEAKTAVTAFTGGPKSATAAGAASGDIELEVGEARTRTYAKSYQFTVGEPGKAETYWDAIRRMADEVLWRAFMDRGTLWFISDETLMRQRPRMTLREPKPGASPQTARVVDSIEFDWDREKPVLEANVTVRTGRWQAPPGCVVQIIDSGPADGRWLVWSIERSLFDKQATVTLRRPHKQKREPAHEVGTVSEGGIPLDDSGTGTGAASGSHVDRAYATAKAIAAKKYNYVYGGGHGSFDGPYDCSGFVSAVLHEAGLGVDAPLDTVALGSWGEPGKGKYVTVWVRPNPGMSGHTFMEITKPDGTSEFFEAGGTKGALTGSRGADRPTAGFEPRHWPGT